MRGGDTVDAARDVEGPAMIDLETMDGVVTVGRNAAVRRSDKADRRDIVLWWCLTDQAVVCWCQQWMSNRMIR